MNTEVIMGSRRSGKSLELIKRSAETGIYIMTASKERARGLYEQARNMGYIIPYPVTMDEYYRSDKFDGSIGLRKGLYIDDVDDVIRRIFYPINIHAVTFTNLYTTDLDSANMKREEWVKFNPHLLFDEDFKGGVK